LSLYNGIRLNRSYILIYLSRYLNQERAKRLFGFWSEAVTSSYQSNQAKLEAIPLSGYL